MLKDISKKLTMKKTFFVTQLEGFFNAISQEYQDLIHQKEVENSLLEEKILKNEKDIKNLVQIKEELKSELFLKDEYIKNLEKKMNDSADIRYKKLLKENLHLKEKINENDSLEVSRLKQQIKNLQNIIAKGASGYNDTLKERDKEALIKEISKTLKK